MTAASNEVVAVIQADRDAYQELRGLWGPKLQAMLDAGEFDGSWDMQVLARHRIAHSEPRPVAEGLREHFERMQDMMRRYIEPITYVASFPADSTKYASEFEEPGPHDSSINSEKKRRRMDRAFISDMIHMMDGPEQRALATHSPAPMAGEVFRQALEDVCNPLGYLQRLAEAEGSRLSGMAYAIANDIATVQRIARDALAAHPSTQEGGK